MTSATMTMTSPENSFEVVSSPTTIPSPAKASTEESQTPTATDGTTPTSFAPQDVDDGDDLDEGQPSALSPEQRTAVIEYLEHRVRDNVRTVNARDWDTLRQARGISPDFQSFADGDSRAMDWQEMVNLRAIATAKFPDGGCRIIDLGTHLNAAANHASVFVLLEVFHPHVRLRGEKMMVYEFSKVKGLWLHCRSTSLRAPLVLEERGDWFGIPPIERKGGSQ